jgi:hypothetical protein
MPRAELALKYGVPVRSPRLGAWLAGRRQD